MNKIHPARAHIYHHSDIGAKIADKVAATVGSWRFILIQSTLLFLWILLNSLAFFVWKWDPAPFILLNLMLSFQAAYTGPVVMMSQNRQAERDRRRDDTEASEVQELYAINKTQLQMLHQQSEILELLKGKRPQRNVKP